MKTYLYIDEKIGLPDKGMALGANIKPSGVFV